MDTELLNCYQIIKIKIQIEKFRKLSDEINFYVIYVK